MADTAQTVIGPETRVAGELRGDESLLVRGRVDGRIQITELLTVEAGGIVQADVEARAVLITGVVAGSVTAVESIRLTNKARVVGDLRAPSIIIEEGALYRGRVDMGDVDAESQASTRASRSSTNGALAKAPPRLTAPARVAASSPARASAPAAVIARPTPPSLPRASSVPAAASPMRSAAPPTLARPDVAATGSAPAWAKKKQLKRR